MSPAYRAGHSFRENRFGVFPVPTIHLRTNRLRIVRHDCGSHEAAFEPRIEITFDQTNKTITVADNGDGMDRADIASLFTKVGSTASQIARAGAHNDRAIREFGIGALSYFLVSEEFQMLLKLNTWTNRRGLPRLGLLEQPKVRALTLTRQGD